MEYNKKQLFQDLITSYGTPDKIFENKRGRGCSVVRILTVIDTVINTSINTAINTVINTVTINTTSLCNNINNDDGENNLKN